MKITREDVLKVAELAHLELTEAEVAAYQGQLDAILRYVEKLNALDTSAVEPLAQVLAAEVSPGAAAAAPELREDTVESSGTAAEVLRGAPDPSRPYFRVPRVIER